MPNNGHMIPPKPPEVRENAAAKPRRTMLCRGRGVEIDLTFKGIKTRILQYRLKIVLKMWK